MKEIKDEWATAKQTDSNVDVTPIIRFVRLRMNNACQMAAK
jgi:hypothetical protein